MQQCLLLNQLHRYNWIKLKFRRVRLTMRPVYGVLKGHWDLVPDGIQHLSQTHVCFQDMSWCTANVFPALTHPHPCSWVRYVRKEKMCSAGGGRCRTGKHTLGTTRIFCLFFFLSVRFQKRKSLWLMIMFMINHR